MLYEIQHLSGKRKISRCMLVKELKPHTLDGRKWVYHDSPVMSIDKQAAQKYDDSLEKMEKKYRPSQDEFYIMSHSYVEPDSAVDSRN